MPALNKLSIYPIHPIAPRFFDGYIRLVGVFFFGKLVVLCRLKSLYIYSLKLSFKILFSNGIEPCFSLKNFSHSGRYYFGLDKR